MTSVTKHFKLLVSCCPSHERLEICSAAFWKLRRSMGAIIRRLSVSEDVEAAEITKDMRTLLYRWLTTPVAFDASIRDALTMSFGDPDAFDRRWSTGGELSAAIRAAGDILSEESPLRARLIEVIRKLRSENICFKIYCHRKARNDFDTLEPAQPLQDSAFLHSMGDYAGAELFDVLIKIGPLRSKGWGAVPDAIKSAPKFKRLIQLVWSGCADDAGFGYDPVEPPSLPGDPVAPHPGDVLDHQVKWTRHATKIGQDPGVSQDCQTEQDEFISLAIPYHQGTRRRAVLIQILDDDGILYPRTAVLSFEPNIADESAVDLRVPGESLRSGMFAIQTQLGEVDFGEAWFKESGYCRIWKERLRHRLESDPDAFCRILRSKGLELLSLRNCVEYWAQPPHAVIHAPKLRTHFQILIDALAIDGMAVEPMGRDVKPWWQRAWDEVRMTRREAIQAGRQEHELVKEQALGLLRSLLPEARRMADGREGFRIQIPAGRDLQGAFVFFRVLRIEEGYLAPDSEIGVVRDLDSLEQWRVT